VPEDFLGELAGLGARRHLERRPADLNDPAAIAATMTRVRADILAVIRGGGPNADFVVFDEARVVKAFAAFAGYRVTGFGHSGNTTALDLIADHAARILRSRSTRSGAPPMGGLRRKLPSLISRLVTCCKRYFGH
jgi:hypothetical protein